MWVYRIQRIDGAWVKGDKQGRPLPAVGEGKKEVIWTREKAEAAWWYPNQNGGAEQWLSWYEALDPGGAAQCKVHEENDPAKSIGGEHD